MEAGEVVGVCGAGVTPAGLLSGWPTGMAQSWPGSPCGGFNVTFAETCCTSRSEEEKSASCPDGCSVSTILNLGRELSVSPCEGELHENKMIAEKMSVKCMADIFFIFFIGSLSCNVKQ